MDKEKWNQLKDWLKNELEAYKSGALMSIAESIHGETAVNNVIAKMQELETN